MISVRVISLSLGQTRSQSDFNLLVLLHNAGYISAICWLCLSWDIIKLSKCYSPFKRTLLVLSEWFHCTPVVCCATLFPQSTESRKQCFCLVFTGVFTFVMQEGWNILYKKWCTQTNLVLIFATNFSFLKKNWFYFFVPIVLCWQQHLKPIHKLLNWFNIFQNVGFPHGGPNFLVYLHNECCIHIRRRQGLQVNKWVISPHDGAHAGELTHAGQKRDQCG